MKSYVVLTVMMVPGGSVMTSSFCLQMRSSCLCLVEMMMMMSCCYCSYSADVGRGDRRETRDIAVATRGQFSLGNVDLSVFSRAT
jgi:hypothetical protein